MADATQNPQKKKKKAGEVESDDVFEPPTLKREPTAKQIQLGGKLLLRVVADGKPRPSYQWYLNGKKITGATSDRYMVNKTRREHAGSYTCEVKNYVGKVTSRAAMISLLVQRIPPLEIAPAASALAAGKPFKLSLTSFPPELAKKFSFQWTFNGKRIVGAKGPTLEFTELKKKYEGEYKIMLLLGGDLRTSNTAKLKVLAAGVSAAEEKRAVVAEAPKTPAPPADDFFFNPEEEEGADEAPLSASAMAAAPAPSLGLGDPPAAPAPDPAAEATPVLSLSTKRGQEKLRRQQRKLEAMLRYWQGVRAEKKAA